jgi:hypothetical protein
MNIKQPWIYTRLFDCTFILLPPFVCIVIVFVFSSYFLNTEVSLAWWITLVLCIDVSHVYSTIYRTYSDKETMNKHRTFLLVMPVVLFVVSILVYQLSALYFWRILAYIAVFHFIRQQYGFLRIYARKELTNKWFELIDKLAIYASTLYPIIFWHLHADRKFHWFVERDFFDLSSVQFLSNLFFWIYATILTVYIIKEIISIKKTGFINVPKNLLVVGTILSWYVGIVLYNGDLVFTLVNIISHGIPYIALVWVYGRKKSANNSEQKWFALVFTPKFFLIFFASLIALAYIEEGLWDATVWHERESFFAIFTFLKDIRISDKIIVPLLVVPQLTHYLIDGFIWKIKKDDFNWKETILPN